YNEDFGQTFAVWGMPDGPFVMIPFFGPSTLRDAVAFPLDWQSNPLVHYDNTSVRDKLIVLRLIELRSRLLAADQLLAGSPDIYVTLRESYLQNRRYQVFDGDPPVDDDFYDDFEDFEDFEDDEQD
ncbi:MAG: MlaA family lipoprotein, partial [Pseudomonadota bacterium]